MIQRITINVSIPDGYEATGDFRWPVVGDLFLTEDGDTVAHASVSYWSPRFILRKKWAFPKWFAAGWFLWFNTAYNKWVVCERVFEGTNTSGFFATDIWAFHGETFVPPTHAKKLQNV